MTLISPVTLPVVTGINAESQNKIYYSSHMYVVMSQDSLNN